MIAHAPRRQPARSRARTMLFHVALAIVATTATPVSTALAQRTVTADALMASGFVWRGINFTNRPVVQGDLYLTQVAGSVTFSAGGWINAEPADYRAANAMRMLAPGHHGPALTAITTWLDASVQTGPATLTGGITAYRYPERTGFAEAYNTTEVYARASGGGVLAPRVQLWWDVQKVQGAYVEAAVAHTFDIGLPVSTALTAGWSAGQEVRGAETAYFNRSGFAALDGSIGLPITRGHFTLQPMVHGVLAHDAATRLVTPGMALQRTKFWWSLGGTWTR